jgi:hypothetical protein
MHHRLRDGLSWCLYNQQSVFLDLPGDRYFRLSADDEQPFQHWARTGAIGTADALRLIAKGVLIANATPSPSRTMTVVAPPSADLAQDAVGEARLLDIGRGLLAQRRATSLIRHGRLASAVAAIGCKPQSRRLPARNPDRAVRRIAAAFASTPLTMRKAKQCLPRALAAGALCHAAGATPTLVFGVQLEPFAAHCWLQWNGAVIVGDLEQARMFAPILAVP